VAHPSRLRLLVDLTGAQQGVKECIEMKGRNRRKQNVNSIHTKIFLSKLKDFVQSLDLIKPQNISMHQKGRLLTARATSTVSVRVSLLAKL
jgi:hypothetical protein